MPGNTSTGQTKCAAVLYDDDCEARLLTMAWRRGGGEKGRMAAGVESGYCRSSCHK